MRSCSWLVPVVLVGCASAPAARPAPSVPVDVVVAPPPPPAPPSPKPAPAPEAAAKKIEPLADATCVIHHEGPAFMGAVVLSLHGKRFARVTRVTDAELRASKSGATMTASTDEVRLTGEIRVPGLSVYTREPVLHEGWLEIDRGLTQGVSGDALIVRARTSSVVTPRLVDVPVPCSALSLGFVKGSSSPKGTMVTFKDGAKTSLRKSPGGPAVASIAVPKLPKPKPKPKKPKAPKPSGRAFAALLGAPVQAVPVYQALELRRQGKSVEVRIRGNGTYARGWIDASALVPPGKSGSSIGVIGGLTGTGMGAGGLGFGTIGVLRNTGAARPKVWVCDEDAPLYVRDRGELVSVGVVRAGAAIHPGARGGDEVPVTIGTTKIGFSAGLAPALPLLMTARSLERCAEK